MKKCMHKIETMPLQTSSIFSHPWQMSQSACFSSKIPRVVIFWWETGCVSKARGWQMPGPREVQNLQMPHPRDWQGEQIPCSSPGGLGAAGIDWHITRQHGFTSYAAQDHNWSKVTIAVKASQDKRQLFTEKAITGNHRTRLAKPEKTISEEALF